MFIYKNGSKLFMKQLLLALALLLILPLAQAQEVTIEVKAIDSVIPAGGEALFQVFITNNQGVNDVFHIKAKELSLYPFSDFAADLRTDKQSYEIKRGTTQAVIVSVRTLSSAQEGKTYELPIEIQSTLDKNLRITESLYIRVLPANQLITIQPELPPELKPGKKVNYHILFTNKGNILLDNAEFYINSPIFTDSRILTFKPGVDIEETFTFDIPEDVEPGSYPVTMRVYHLDEIKGVYSGELVVTENEKLTETKNVEEGFLKTTTTLTYENTGNSPIIKEVIYDIKGLPRFFTSTTPLGEKVEQGYRWEFTVNRGKTHTIIIKTNYFIPLLIFILVLVILFLVYYYYNKKLHLKKKIFKVNHDKEEGMSELKIILHLRNKTGKQINGVKLVDLVPTYVILSKDYQTLKPEHIQQGSSGGHRLIWDIGTLAPTEERIISYKIKARTGDIGSITLPGCNVTYYNQDGSSKNIQGNSVTYRTP
ncbi:MAG: hypothetical protein Q7R56_03630 [Nanoarchaeota archaeon]|nr:hypothetical protein [Nanoarchaeota archaeon]